MLGKEKKERERTPCELAQFELWKQRCVALQIKVKFESTRQP